MMNENIRLVYSAILGLLFLLNPLNANMIVVFLLRKQFAVSNPFVFKHISNLKGMQHFDDIGPCVIMASPGMLQVMRP